MTTRDIASELKDLYGVEVSASFISNVTDSIMPVTLSPKIGQFEMLVKDINLD
jgi:transposase-like protein